MVVGAHRQGAGPARTGAEHGSGRFADPVRHQNPRRILPDRAVCAVGGYKRPGLTYELDGRRGTGKRRLLASGRDE